MADDRSIVIKKADEGSYIVVWDRTDYLREAEKQLEDPNVYRKVAFKDKILSQLVDCSNRFFKNLKMKGHITEKELKYFSYEFKKSCNLGELYLLPKIHKSLENVPGRPVISNCGTPTEKVSEFLDHHLKPVMQGGKSYIKDSGHFLEKIKTLRCIPDNALLVTADVVGLYPSIPHQAGLIALKEALDKRLLKKIPTDDLIKMAEFVLSNNFFEFNSDTFQQISGTAIGTKFAPPYACIYMDQVEQKFLATQINQPLIWLRYIDDIFFIWTHGEKELEKFMSSFNSFTPNLKFTYESSKKDISFLDLKVSLSKNKLSTDLHIKPTDCHQYLHYSSGHPEHTKRSIVYSLLLRVNWICSSENDFNRHKSNMKIWFQKRGYPENIIENEMKKVNFPSCNKVQRKKSNSILFLVAYCPLLK